MNASNGTIDPSIFASRWTETAKLAAEKDRAHNINLKSSSGSLQDKIQDFRNSKEDWMKTIAPPKDSFQRGGTQSTPDGGMRKLAQSLGKV